MAAVQDDRRENEMCSFLALRKGVGRSDTDAFHEFETPFCTYSVPIELKSTTTHSVSTARDVGPAHIEKWRSRVWVFGFYDATGKSLESLLVLGPRDIESWIAQVEAYIAPDFAVGERAAQRLTVEDLFVVCGEKSVYSQQDAQRLHKKQWTKKAYKEQMDLPSGYSPERMLKLLQERALYLNARGATLNNPHIPKTFFASFDERRLFLGQKTAEETKELVHLAIQSIAITEQREDWMLRQGN